MFYYFFQVRTLFVSGLPMDTKPRELYLLFRAYEVTNLLYKLKAQSSYEIRTPKKLEELVITTENL